MTPRRSIKDWCFGLQEVSHKCGSNANWWHFLSSDDKALHWMNLFKAYFKFLRKKNYRNWEGEIYIVLDFMEHSQVFTMMLVMNHSFHMLIPFKLWCLHHLLSCSEQNFTMCCPQLQYLPHSPQAYLWTMHLYQLWKLTSSIASFILWPKVGTYIWIPSWLS